MAWSPQLAHFPDVNSIHMTLKNIIAAILITLGFVVLAYSGISFTTPGETVQFLGLRIETTHTHFIPPIVGAEVVPLAEPGGPLHGARGTTSTRRKSAVQAS